MPEGYHLLRQPHRFECFMPREKGVDQGHPAVTRRAMDRKLLVKLNAARISTHADAPEPENGLAEIPHFTVLELEHLPGLEHCLDPIAHLVIASIDGPL